MFYLFSHILKIFFLTLKKKKKKKKNFNFYYFYTLIIFTADNWRQAYFVLLLLAYLA